MGHESPSGQNGAEELDEHIVGVKKLPVGTSQWVIGSLKSGSKISGNRGTVGLAAQYTSKHKPGGWRANPPFVPADSTAVVHVVFRLAY